MPIDLVRQADWQALAEVVNRAENAADRPADSPASRADLTFLRLLAEGRLAHENAATLAPGPQLSDALAGCTAVALRLLEVANGLPDDRRGDALALLQIAVTLVPDCAAAWLRMAWLRYDAQQANEAIAAAKKAQQHARDEAQHLDCCAALGWFFLDKGDLDAAEAILIPALANDPPLAVLHWHMGTVHFRRHRLAEAAKALGTALAIDPSLDEAAASLAWVLHDLGRLAEATIWARHALACKPLAERKAQLGWLLLLQEAFDEAAELLQAALSEAPTLVRARCNLVSALEQLGQLDEAIDVLQRGLALAPDEPDLLLPLGWLRHRRGDEDAARTAIERLLRNHPDQASAWHLLGILSQQAGDLEKAEQCFAEVQARDESLTEALFSRAALLRQMKRLAEAAATLHVALRHAPENIRIRTELVGVLLDLGETEDARHRIHLLLREVPQDGALWHLLAQTLLQRQRRKTAIHALRRAHRLSPARYGEQLGWLLLQDGQFEAAVALLQTVLSEDPAQVQVRCNLVSALQHLERLDEADDVLQRGLALAPEEPDLLLSLGWQRHHQGDDGAARIVAEQLIRGHPEFASAWHLMGVLWQMDGRLDKAEQCFAEVEARDSSLTGALISRAKLLRQMKRTADAVTTLEAALRHAPDHIGVLTELVDVSLEQGDTEGARRGIHPLLRRYPHDGALWHRLARILQQRRRCKLAVLALRRARRLSPEDGKEQLEWLLLLQEKYDDAITLLQAALLDEPSWVEARSSLVNALRHQGRIDEAVEVLQNGLKLLPDAPDLLLALGWLQYDLGNREAAQAVAERLVRNHPDLASAWHLMGILWHEKGNLETAEQCLAEAQSQDGSLIDAVIGRASILDTTERSAEAVTLLHAALRQASDQENHKLIGALLDLGEIDESRNRTHQLLKQDKQNGVLWHLLGRVLTKRQRQKLAIHAHRRACRLAPDNPEVWRATAWSAQENRDHLLARSAIDRLLSLASGDAQSQIQAAFVLESCDDVEAAAAHAESAVAGLPGNAEAWRALAKVRYRQGRLEEAEEALQTALEVEPKKTHEACRQLGWVFVAANRLEEAESIFARTALDHGEDFQIWCALAEVRRRAGHFAEAEDALDQALNKRPDWPQTRLLLAHIHADQGPDHWNEAVSICSRLLREGNETDGAALLLMRLSAHGNEAALEALKLIECKLRANLYAQALLTAQGERGNQQLRRMASLAHKDLPEDMALATAAFFACGLDEKNSPPEVMRHARQWLRQLMAATARSVVFSLPARREKKKMRVAYVAAHFHRSLLVRVLAAHDHKRIDVYLYTDAPAEALVGLGRHVRIHPLHGQDLAASMRANRIDIAVDTVGIHPFLGQFEVLRQFSRRIAPLQCAWLGSWASSAGLFDVLIADSASLPQTLDNLYEEAVVRLPGGQWCWDPPAVSPEIVPPPCLARKSVTFGSAVRGLRLTQRTQEAWAALLASVPGARLELIGAQSGDRQFQTGFSEILGSHGIDPERVRYRPRCSYEDYLAFYGDIDIALDAFPANGGLCLLDALWMGVPLVTRAGTLLGERQGLSLLTSIGHIEWVAFDDAAYVDIAATLARNPDALVALRKKLRQELLDSPLLDGRRVAQALERSYEQFAAPAKDIAAAESTKERDFLLARRQFSTWCAKTSRLDFSAAAPSADTVPDISVVVVLFNQASLARHTLSALADQSGVSYEVTVIDNASTDETPRLLDRLDSAHIVRNDENNGFLHAANQGAALAKGRHILFLSGNTVLPSDTLHDGVRRLDAEADIGAVGGKGAHDDALIQDQDSDLNYFLPEFCFERNADIRPGAFLMVRHELWNRLGGFDNTYAPAYRKDTDFCTRICKAGYRVVFAQQAVVPSLERSSTLPNRRPPGARRDPASAWRHTSPSTSIETLPKTPIGGQAPRSDIPSRIAPTKTIQLRTTAQSFDLFDTLIARACVTPANLFAEVGEALGLNDFPSARMSAEQRVFAATDTFDLEAIYRELCASGYCDMATARRLMSAEIQAEFDNAIPIAENIAAVRDLDLVVSDMYLPPAILRGLLQHVGLRRFVHLHVTNVGKHRGTIWPQLTQHWLILRHIGDNEHADVQLPRKFGIATDRYTGATMSNSEQDLENAGLRLLARITRRLRLANPFPSGSIEAGLWKHFVEFNVPLLCLAAAEARRQRDSTGKSRILFIGRDCHFLSEIFLALFPAEPCELIHVSRTALAADPTGFADYLDHSGLGNALLCDLVSTGLSWLRFSQSTMRPTTFFTVVHIDNYQYETFDPSELDQEENYRFLRAVRASELGSWSMAIEVLNTAPHGSTLGTKRVGDTFVPQFEAQHELPATMLKSIILAQAAAVSCLRAQRSELERELASVADQQEILSTLISALSSADWLNQLASAAICKQTD